MKVYTSDRYIQDGVYVSYSSFLLAIGDVSLFFFFCIFVKFYVCNKLFNALYLTVLFKSQAIFLQSIPTPTIAG